MSFEEFIHILYFTFEVLVNIGDVGDRLSSFVDDEARTTWIREFIYAFIRNDFDELDLAVLMSYRGKVVID